MRNDRIVVFLQKNNNLRMLKENKKHLWEAVSYVFLLVFFTYTAIAVELLKDCQGVWEAYALNQSSVFALLTNFGLLVLMIIDYVSGKTKVNAQTLIRVSLCFFTYIVIYGHAKVVSHPVRYSDYGILLSFPSLFIFLHLLTLCYLVFVKYQTLKEFRASRVE